MGGQIGQSDFAAVALRHFDRRREVFGDRIRKGDFAAAGHIHEQQGREHLRHGADFENRIAPKMARVVFGEAAVRHHAAAIGVDDAGHHADAQVFRAHAVGEDFADFGVGWDLGERGSAGKNHCGQDVVWHVSAFTASRSAYQAGDAEVRPRPAGTERRQPESYSIMLELRNVSKRYSGVTAVDHVSFQARAGEVTGYLGPNGSGKSTTMKMITGLIEMTPARSSSTVLPSTAT